MKKILVTIMLFSYTFATSGASVELHYCMGKLIAWDFEYTSKNDCRNCSMKTKPPKGCCDNKQIQAKVDKEQQATFNNISIANNLIAILPVYKTFADALVKAKTIIHPSTHGPPLINSTAFYLFICNFRI